jgi:hypothetical protein
VPAGWLREPGIKRILGPRHVRADLLLADLDVLQPVMERAYGGWDSAAARGWNWNQWFADWRRMLAAKGSARLAYDEAFAPVDALMKFQRDNHTQIPLDRMSTSDGSETAVLAETPHASCTEFRAGGQTYSISAKDAAQHVHRAKLWDAATDALSDGDYIAMPSSFGAPEEIHCGQSWIGLEPADAPTGGGWESALNKDWNALRPERPRIRRLGEGVVYIRLPTFDWRNYQNVSAAGWPQREAEDRVLIVDLRDNGGGNEGYGLAVLRGWIDEQKMVAFRELGTQTNSSCLYAPLKWNSEILFSPAALTEDKGYMQGLLDRMAETDPPGCPRREKTNPARWTYTERHFDPRRGQLRIVALVNSRCASDCELIAERLASLPETIVAGTNTEGVGQFIQPGYAVLPHTGLIFRIALGRSNFYGDNRSFDGYGLDVDIVLPDVDGLRSGQLLDLANAVRKLEHE